jgi:sugar lactone lactonase YvrE
MSFLRRWLYRQRLAARIAAEISRSTAAPGHVVWVSVDSDGTVYVAAPSSGRSHETRISIVGNSKGVTRAFSGSFRTEAGA